MMKKHYLVVITLFALVVSACRLTVSPLVATSTPGPTETPSPLPTFTPLPTPTPTPTPIPEVRIDRADHFLFLGDYDRALEEYQLAFLQALTDEERAVSLVGMGQVYFLQDRYQEAIDAFKTVLDVYPEGYHVAKSIYYLAQTSMAMGNYLDAAGYYERFLELKPGLLDFYVQDLRGDALSEAGQLAEAISAYQSAVDASGVDEGINIEIKMARAYAQTGDLETAIRLYMEIFEKSSDDYVKAQMNFLAGQAYLQIGLPEQAYARFQDSVHNYPRAYDTYSGLEALVAASQPVDILDSGLVYYFAGEYGKAVEAFQKTITDNPEHDGTAHHYLAYSLIVMEDIEGALNEWQALIDDHPGDRFWADAWDEIAYTLWAYLGRYDQAAQTYLDFVSLVPSAPEAPTYLYRGARIYEQNGKLEVAAENWERMIVEYPENEQSLRGLFLAGICYYRVGDFAKAETTFQRVLVLASDEEYLAAAHLWLGKLELKMENDILARQEWEKALEFDPTGYYSERAKELLEGKNPMEVEPDAYNLEFDIEYERKIAEAWIRSAFAIPDETDLSSLVTLNDNTHMRRGIAFWELGLFERAGAEFDIVRTEIESDPVNNYRLMNYLLERGFYRHAILISRKILDLAHFDDASSLLAPIYFNRVRFGTYFSDLIVPAANEIRIEPLVLFSLVRQESFFEWSAGSIAGAQGLMQLIPATGQEMANYIHWPQNYTDADLLLPMVNVELGTRYLQRQREFLGKNNIYAALAAYNAGPSNAENWYQIGGDDPDLFLEVVRFAETRNYIVYIFEAMHIYEQIYSSVQNE